MKSEENNDYQIKTSGPDAKLDTSVAFLQVPTKIKDQVKAFIDEIADAEDAEKIASGDAASPFQSTGCFFVISLEQIEQIHGYLKKALEPNENDVDSIRVEVKKALTALQGT